MGEVAAYKFKFGFFGFFGFKLCLTVCDIRRGKTARKRIIKIHSVLLFEISLARYCLYDTHVLVLA